MQHSSPFRLVLAIGQLHVGGSERQLYNFLKYVDRSLFKPEVWVFSSDGVWLDRIKQLRVEVLRLPESNPLWRALKIRELCRKREVDIWWSWSYFLNIYAHFLPGRVKKVGSLRSGLGPTRKSMGFWYRFCESGLDLMVVNSSQGLKDLKREGYSGTIAWVGNMIEVPPISEEERNDIPRRLYGRDNNEFIVTTVGRLNEDKNIDIIIDAVSTITNTNVRLVVVGEGPARSDLERNVLERGLEEYVLFTGEVGVDKVFRIVAASDLLVHASNSEGTPNAVMEAMALGIPVIATNVGGMRDLIPSDEFGYIVPPQDVDALRSAIAAVLQDPFLATARAARARARLEVLFNPGRVTRIFERWMLYLLGKRESCPASFDLPEVAGNCTSS